MVDEPVNNAVTTIMDSEPSARPVSPKPRRTRKTPKKNNTHVRLPQMPEEEQRSKVWLSTLANLVLLIAIFTIVFAAHRAIQTHIQTQAPVAAVSEQPQQQPTAQPETVTAEPEAEETEPSQVSKQTEETKEETKPETEPIKQTKRIRLTWHDPYTSGGQHDLDRVSDHNNPWNAGGVLDLDNNTMREEYKKNNYISIVEPANQ